MENIQIIPVFGKSFTFYVPILMIIMALITLFDLFARILQLAGIETEESSVKPFSWFLGQGELTGELLEKYNAGKLMIENEIRRLENQNEQLRKMRDPGTNRVGGSGKARFEDEFDDHQGSGGGGMIGMNVLRKITAPHRDLIKPVVTGRGTAASSSFDSNYSSTHSKDAMLDHQYRGGGGGGGDDDDIVEIDLDLDGGIGGGGSRKNTGRNSYTSLKTSHSSSNSKPIAEERSSIFSSTISANNQQKGGSSSSSSSAYNAVKNPLQEEQHRSAKHSLMNTTAANKPTASIFSSLTNPSKPPKNPPTTLLGTQQSLPHSSDSSKLSYSKLTSKAVDEDHHHHVTEEKSQKAKPKNIFSFDDDEDDKSTNFGGRYSNF
jgi:hypothetical protein